LDLCAGEAESSSSARPLGISLSSVRNHLYEIFTKLNVSSRMGAIMSCLRWGLISIDELTKKNIEPCQAEATSLQPDVKAMAQVEL
jgi:hypothetical protein